MGWKNDRYEHGLASKGVRTRSVKRNLNPKVKEIITLNIFGGESVGTVNDKRGMISYDSIDEALEVAQEIWRDYNDTYPDLAISVSFDEYLHESGDILGDPTTLGVEDFGIKLEKPMMAMGKKSQNWMVEANKLIDENSQFAYDVADSHGQNFNNVKHTRWFREAVAEELLNEVKSTPRWNKLKKVVIYDNGGETMDRYSIIIGDAVYGMSKHPTHPQGFGQYVGERSRFPNDLSHLGKKINIDDLSIEVISAINDRLGD